MTERELREMSDSEFGDRYNRLYIELNPDERELLRKEYVRRKEERLGKERKK